MLMVLVCLFSSRVTAFMAHSFYHSCPTRPLYQMSKRTPHVLPRFATTITKSKTKPFAKRSQKMTPTASLSSVSFESLPPDTLYVLDGTAMMYRAFHGMESQKRYRRVVTSPQHDSIPCGALASFSSTLARVIRDINPMYMAAAFDTGKTFRNDIFAAYKQNRQETPPELSKQFKLAPLVGEAFGCRCLWLPGFEADDVMASLAELAQRGNRTVVLVSSDKDMLQLVHGGDDDSPAIYIMNPQTKSLSGVKEVEEKYGVPPKQLCHVMALIGDSADNIPGVKGVGPRSAAALVRAFGSIEGILEAIAVPPGRADVDVSVVFTEALRDVKVSAEAIVRSLRACKADDLKLYRDLITLRRHIDIPKLLSRPSAQLYTNNHFDSADAYSDDHSSLNNEDVCTSGVNIQLTRRVGATAPTSREDRNIATAETLEKFRYLGCSESAGVLADSLTRCGTFRKILDTLHSHNSL